MFFMDEIFRALKFSDEEFWLTASIPLAIFSIICVVVYARESAEAKAEDREKKKSIRILFGIGATIGIIELFALLQALLIFAAFKKISFLMLAVPLSVVAIVYIVRFIFKAAYSKYEEEPLETGVKVKFIISLVFCAFVIFLVARNFKK
ncbi:MAG: hypothetical protein IKO54_09415 [Lachnospiraceae bacterium]|nr:hypothetical protein [Lachnospiraceae bacterium]